VLTVNILGENMEALSEARRWVGLEVSAENIEYVVMSYHQNAGQNHNLLIDKSLKMWQNLSIWNNNKKSGCIHEGIKSRLNSQNSCYCSVQDFLSSCLLLKNPKIELYKTMILPIVSRGHETLSHTLRAFENMVLRRMFVLKIEEVVGGWRRLCNELNSL
jgi:hypothetical protein